MSLHILYTGLRAPAPQAGMRITHAPLLRSVARPIDPDPLNALLAASPCAIITFSPRSAQAIAALALTPGPYAHIGWAVGQRSAQALHTALPWLTAVHTPDDDTQHFEGLCAALQAAHATKALPKTLIALALEDSPRDLATALAHLPDITVHTVEVYATEPAPSPALPPDADWIVLTSPRGAQALHAQLGPARPTAKLAAIGPTTAAALTALGWPPDLTPPTPALDDLWPLLGA
jgi:uroporphyrinogen-III synthase